MSEAKSTVSFVASSPDPEVAEKTKRRKFSAEEKKRILEEVDRSAGHGGHWRRAEWGYFALSELESARGPWGLPIERDLYFRTGPFSEVLARFQGRAGRVREGRGHPGSSLPFFMFAGRDAACLLRRAARSPPTRS